MAAIGSVCIAVHFAVSPNCVPTIGSKGDEVVLWTFLGGQADRYSATEIE